MSDSMEPPDADVSGLLSESENEYDDHDPDSQLKEDEDKMNSIHGSGDLDSNGEPKKKYDPKDPMRPRRKKARRACYACQRAHLTCGDERPCQRCIKRGLADACQDGVRKKAKYLHDAPPEALRDVLGPSFEPKPSATRPTNGHRQPSNSGSEASSNVGSFFSPQSNTSGFAPFSAGAAPLATIQEALPFGGQSSALSPTFQSPSNPMGNITVPQVTNEIPNFTPALFDPSNPAIFNFNLEGLNFGSQYGALEFGMLGHMSSGAARTPPKDPSLSQQGSGDATFSSSVYGNGATQFDKVYDGNPMMGDILGLDQNGSGMYSQGNLQHGLPHAYAIAAGPSSLQSPSTENNSPQPTTFGYEGSPTTATYNLTGGSSAPAVAQPRPKTKMATLARIGPQSVLGKRQRDPSYIYETVKEPFPYVSSFHNLIYHIQNRFSKDQSLRIAKALASIRSPLISCMRTLNRRDLVFMEQSFQRALFEYEDFMLQCSSPAIACRRSGELAGVNKEFTALTGWTKEVLLGKEPNLNANTGVSSASGTSSGRAGLTTPKLRSMNPDPSPDRPRQPVFLAELMDDDSVIDFYEDYAHLAFNDSRGKVYRKCRLLKYRTQQAMDAVKPLDETPQKDPRLSILSNRVAKIDGEHGISKLERDGKLECSYTFAIKRDTFDIPMMIIVNFLPCYYRNHNQLAV